MLRYLLVFIVLSVKVVAQEPDTLLTSILRMENDTERVNQLYTQGFDLIDKDPQIAFEYAQNCEKIAQQSKSQKHISKSYTLLGILFTKQSQYQKALAYFEKYMLVQKSVHNGLGMAIGYTNLGNVYLRLKQFEKAERYFLLAVEYYNVLNNRTEVANGLINLGVLKHQQKQLDAALQNYEKALQAGKELNNYDIKSICFNNLAQVFSDLGNYEKAIAYNYEALELRSIMGLDVDRTDSYLSIAEIALKQKNTGLAEENLNLALTLCSKLDYLEGKMIYHKLLSELYSQKNNFQLAYESLITYNNLKDSLQVLHDEEPDFDLKEENALSLHNVTTPIKNLWLLSLLSLFLIIIPFVLIRYKR